MKKKICPLCNKEIQDECVIDPVTDTTWHMTCYDNEYDNDIGVSHDIV